MNTSYNLPTLLRYALTVSLGGFLFGYDAAVISGAIGYLNAEFGLTPIQTGFVVAAPSMTAIAAIAAGPISDYVGRKRILIAISLAYIVSAAMSAVAPSYTVLVIARALGGFAFASLALAPIYITEIAPSHLRGRLVSINQFNIVVGFSAAYFGNDFFQKISGSDISWVIELGVDQNTWRWMLGAELIPATLYFLLLLGVPESPRWLALKGKTEAARNILAKLYPAETLEKELAAIKQSSEEGISFIKGLLESLSPALRFTLLIGIILAIAQQVSGINSIYFYAPTIFEQSGVGTDAAFTQAVWIGITNIIFTILAISLIDKLGRKPLLVGGLLGVVISMSICSYGFKQAYYEIEDTDLAAFTTEQQTMIAPLVGERYDSDIAFKAALQANIPSESYAELESQLLQAGTNMNATLLLIGVLGFVASFAASLGPVMWVMLPEIFPNHLRGVGMALTGIFNTISSYLVQLVFPWELANWGASMTFGIYAALAVVNLILVVTLFPETKGKSIEELTKVLQKGHQKSNNTAAEANA